MNQINTQYYQTSYGELILGSFDNKLCLCDWRYRKMRTAIDSRLWRGLEAEYVEKPDEVLNNTIQQLEEYFLAKRKQLQYG